MAENRGWADCAHAWRVGLPWASPQIEEKPGPDRPHRDRLRPALMGASLVPAWAKDAKIARSTYNARSETVGEKPSFRDAWKRGQL